MLLITRKDLLEAIEKCQGQKNPNANTCIKLAAYYTILDHTPEDNPGYSYMSQPSNSEFINLIKSRSVDEVLLIMDDMMEQLQVVAPKLYYETMERLTET
jgi:hypothetical protein